MWAAFPRSSCIKQRCWVSEYCELLCCYSSVLLCRTTMHQMVLLIPFIGEGAHCAKGFGWSGLDGGKHDWEVLRQNVQDHIKSLNFSYRVQLREAGVTYLNKLGSYSYPIAILSPILYYQSALTLDQRRRLYLFTTVTTLIIGKFIGPNTMEVTDAKGKASTITAARFVIATGGRPTQLDIPGEQHE